MNDQMTLLDVPKGSGTAPRLVRLMDLYDVSPAEVAEVAGCDVDAVQAVIHGTDPDATDLRADLLDVACERAVDAAMAVRVDPSRPELWAAVRRAASLATELMGVAP